jgi:hypothetical protein
MIQIAMVREEIDPVPDYIPPGDEGRGTKHHIFAQVRDESLDVAVGEGPVQVRHDLDLSRGCHMPRYFSSFERRLSFNTRPPVCSFGQ